MAGYKGHLAFAGGLGFVYGGLANRLLELDTATAILGTGLTTVGGLLPDLDSNSGVPVREMFTLAAALVPMLLMRRLLNSNLSDEEVLLYLGGIYLGIRFVLSRIFKRLVVHRGMFHSIPAMLIAGLVVYLCYHSPYLRTRLFLAVGVMIGFLSHLVLDEIYSVDFNGVKIKLKGSSGTALKLYSPSMLATGITYLLLGLLSYVAIRDYEHESGRKILPWAEGHLLYRTPHF